MRQPVEFMGRVIGDSLDPGGRIRDYLELLDKGTAIRAFAPSSEWAHLVAEMLGMFIDERMDAIKTQMTDDEKNLLWVVRP